MKYTYKTRIIFDYKKQNERKEFVLLADGCETDIRTSGESLRAERAFVKKINQLGIKLEPINTKQNETKGE